MHKRERQRELESELCTIGGVERCTEGDEVYQVVSQVLNMCISL